MALLVRRQVTRSWSARELLLKLSPLPAALPLTCHWYCGAGPPLMPVAVNVTGMPAQMPLRDAVIVTAGRGEGVTDSCTGAEEAAAGVAHAASLVRRQVIRSPSFRLLLVKMLLPAPAAWLLTSH